MLISFYVNRPDVLSEVAMTSGYTGAKMEGGDDKVFDRVTAVDEDAEQLERFWQEAQAEVASELKGVLSSESMSGDVYMVTLSVSNAFEPALQPSMQKSLRCFFVQWLLSKWFTLANKGDAEMYATMAASSILDVKQKAFFKRKPKRLVY